MSNVTWPFAAELRRSPKLAITWSTTASL